MSVGSLSWMGEKGLTCGYNNMNAEHSEPNDLRHFTRITSSVYRQLKIHSERIFAQWVSDEQRARGASGGGCDAKGCFPFCIRRLRRLARFEVSAAGSLSAHSSFSALVWSSKFRAKRLFA
jgi:hypothetical protein